MLGTLGIVAGLAWLAMFGFFFFASMGGGDYMSCLNKAGDDPAMRQQCEQQFNQHVDQKFSITLTPTP